MKANKILGVSASLRNARRGIGNHDLIQDIISLESKEELKEYLEQQAFFHLENFREAGRTDELPFDEMYKNLKKQKGDRGLSNSEVALAAALWSAKELGSEIDHISLSEYYTESGVRNEEDLIEKLKEANGILLSTPVYFGDRGSLAQTFVELVRSNSDLREEMRGKIYGGIAVGAKRNGGQETTLIYQLLDMLNLNLLGVGNDSETTSQYGGTGLAGDVGTMPKDEYGLSTAMGTGRRLSRVTQMINMSEGYSYQGKFKVQFWILQDKDDKALDFVNDIIKKYGDRFDPVIVYGSEMKVMRCLACDVCPTDIDMDDKYRCIIKSKNDDLEAVHSDFLDSDAVIPVVYSAKDVEGIKSNYQKFMERTRYLRRGDYVMSDIVSAPLVLEELGSHENMQIRMITSMIRHHTIVSKPVIGYLHDGEMVNKEQVYQELDQLLNTIKEVAKGRLLVYSDGSDHLKYKPVGYVLSTVKDQKDEKLKRRVEMMGNRKQRVSQLRSQHIASKTEVGDSARPHED